MRKYIIMGPQGSGKGTQARMLSHELDLIHISVGDMFRWNVQNHTKLGARVKRIVDVGNLVPDEIVAQMVSARLQEHDWNYGFMLDGFPRNQSQAEFFLESYDIDAVILIDVPIEVSVERSLARRLCSQCGLDYNLIFHRPEQEDTCDVCGGKLIQRTDDNEQALRSRLNDFQTKTRPVIDLFARKELIVRLDGTQHRDHVYAALRAGLGLPPQT